MKVNGALVFDASSASEIQNLRVQKVAGLPTYGSADAGRMVFHTGEGKLYFGVDGSGWVAIATGGNASALLAEVDALEVSLGSLVNADGSFNASALTGTLGSSTSVTNVFEKIQTLLASAKSATETEVARALAAESTLAAAVSAEVLNRDAAILVETQRAQAAESTLAASVVAEATARDAAILVETQRAISAETTLAAAIVAEATARDAAILVETQRAISAETSLAASVVAEATARDAAILVETQRAISAETSLGARVTAEATARDAAILVETQRAQAAESTLTTNLAAEVAARTAEVAAEVAARTAADSAELSRAQAAELVLTTDLSTEVADRIAAISAEAAARSLADFNLEQSFNAKVAGLTWKNSVKALLTGADASLSGEMTVDGVAVVAGDRVLVNLTDVGAQWKNGIYVAAAGSWVRSTDMDASTPINEFNSAAVFVEQGGTYGDTGWTEVLSVSVIGSDPVQFTQFNGAAGIDAGAGLSKVGNTVAIGAGDSSITVDADSIKVSATYTAARQAEVTAEASRAQGAEGTLTAGLASEVADRQAAVATLTSDLGAEVTRATAAEGVLTSAVAAETARAQAAEAALSTAAGSVAADLATETAARIAADTALSSSLTAEAATARAAESSLASDLGAEVTRAKAAETVVSNAVAAEVTRATAAEGVLTAAVAAEVTRAQAAEAALTTAVAGVSAAVVAEASAARAAEAAIDAKIGKMYFLYSGAAATSHIVTHGLGQKYCSVTVVDSTDEVVIPQSISFTSASELVVTFNTAIAAKVIVMGLA